MIARLKAALDWLEAAIARIPFVRIWFLVVLGVLLVVTLWPWLQTLPLRPITTRGQIYVESPEVYTRERLVNDRYGQAFWLEQQLEKLDEAQNFTSVRRDLALKLAFRPGEGDKLPPLAELSAPPFEHEFQIRSALRDRIRQALLENQLDDRHDLTGNSVYGLKFDTSVIPGTNTRTRAYVRVRVVPSDLPGDDELPELLSNSLIALREHADKRISEFPDHYEKWNKDIERRLNTYLSDIPEDEANPAAWPCWSPQSAAIPQALAEEDKAETRTILAEALAKVLAVDERIVRLPANLFDDQDFGTTGAIDLPEPWNRYVDITLAHNAACQNWKRFVVEPIQQILMLIPADMAETLTQEENKALGVGYLSLGKQTFTGAEGVAGDYYVYVIRQNTDGNPWPSHEEYERLKLHFKIDARTGPHILSNATAFDICAAPLYASVTQDGACRVKGRHLSVETGLYNFARDILELDSYLYTVFPKSDVSGVLERSLLSSSVGLEAAGQQGGVSSFVNEASSKLVTSQVSFADSTEEHEISFGWVIGSKGVQEAVQKSQFVLLSLPAYLRRLELEIETGWLDRNSTFHPDGEGGTSYRMSVALPPDYEAFDTLISGSKRYGPAIFDRLMEDMTVEACARASILIPGARLWRSSQVMLAGQPADQIIVMPNMRGIIAVFKRVAPVRNASGARKVSIQVWTSEGSDRVEKKIAIRPGPEPGCGPAR